MKIKNVLILDENSINSKITEVLLNQLEYYADKVLQPNMSTFRENNKDYNFAIADHDFLKSIDKETNKVAKNIKESMKIPFLIVVVNNECDKESLISQEFDYILTRPVSLQSIEKAIHNSTQVKGSSAAEIEELDIERAGISLGITDIPLLKNIFKEFFLTSDISINSLREAANKNDLKTLRSVAHNLKGVTKNLRLDYTASISEKIEKYATNGNESVDYMELIDLLNKQFTKNLRSFNNKYDK